MAPGASVIFVTYFPGRARFESTRFLRILDHHQHPPGCVHAGDHVSLSASELLLLEFLTAVENGSCREELVPTDGLIAEGYIVPVDGRVCLTMAGVAKIWELRERHCASRLVRQNSSLEPALVSRVVHSLRSAGRIA